MMGYVLDGGGPKDSENTHNSFLTKRDEDAFWQIGTEMCDNSSLDTSHYCKVKVHGCLRPVKSSPNV